MKKRIKARVVYEVEVEIEIEPTTREIEDSELIAAADELISQAEPAVIRLAGVRRSDDAGYYTLTSSPYCNYHGTLHERFDENCEYENRS
jgi:hypothetical protein